MRSLRMRRLVAACAAVLLAGCADIPFAAVPFSAAVASCTGGPATERMVASAPEGVSLIGVGGVRVQGPTRGALAPPVLAPTFQQAMEQTLRNAGVLQAGPAGQGLILQATLVTEERDVSLWRTGLSLSVRYELLAEGQAGPLKSLTLTTTDAEEDWKRDACVRLRSLQERLVRANLSQMLSQFLKRE